jgi:hypothetical protein
MVSSSSNLSIAARVAASAAPSRMPLGQHANDILAARLAMHTLTAVRIFLSMMLDFMLPLLLATMRAIERMTSTAAS